MIYLKPSTLHNPAASGTAPHTWGDAINDCLDALNTGFRVPLFPFMTGEAADSGLQAAGLLRVQSSGAGTIKPQYKVLTFDKDTDEGRLWDGSLPRLYVGTMTLSFEFYMPTVTTGTVVFSSQIACWSATDATVGAKVMAAANSCAALTVPGTALTLMTGSITMTNADSGAALDTFSLAFFRDVSEDTAAEDVYLKRLDLLFNLS